MAASRRALVGAPSARGLASGHESAQVACVSWASCAARPRPGLVSSAARFAALAGLGRPCGFGPQGLVCGLCALHAGAPVCPRAHLSVRPRGPPLPSPRDCFGPLRNGSGPRNDGAGFLPTVTDLVRDATRNDGPRVSCRSGRVGGYRVPSTSPGSSLPTRRPWLRCVRR